MISQVIAVTVGSSYGQALHRHIYSQVELSFSGILYILKLRKIIPSSQIYISDTDLKRLQSHIYIFIKHYGIFVYIFIYIFCAFNILTMSFIKMYFINIFIFKRCIK